MYGKTLIIQPLPGIGDMIWHLPAIRAIAAKSQDNKVSMLVKPSAQVDKLLGHEGILDNVINLENGKVSFKMFRFMCRQEFDTAFIFHHSPKYSFLASFTDVIRRYGYGFGMQKWFLNTGKYLKQEDLSLHNIEKMKKFLHLNGFSDLEKLFYISANPAAVEKICALTSPKPWFTFGIGATEQRRIWPAGHFARLANKITETYGGTVFLLGTANEQHIADAIKAKSPTSVEFIDHSLEVSVALIAESDVFIGNDSGLMNIAAVLNKPTIGIFPDHKMLNYVDNLVGICPDVEGIETLGVEKVMQQVRKVREVQIQK